MTQTLLSPLQPGTLNLEHRIVMAPLTRMRAAQPGNVPHALNVEYYRQRASQGGLIITEGSQISPTGQGMPATPGIHSDAQIAGWQAVTEAVHTRPPRRQPHWMRAGRMRLRSAGCSLPIPTCPSAHARDLR